MRHLLLSVCILAALMAGSTVDASASWYLHFTGFLYGTGQGVSVRVDGTNYNNMGLGPVTGWRSAVANPTESQKEYFENPLYCLDIFHSYTWSDSWWADAYVVPPYNYPPPYNTAEAAWIYESYGTGPMSADEAKGVQLALWEVSHEQAWRTTYLASNQTWASAGGFQITGGANSGSRAVATSVLDALYAQDPGTLTASAVYYRPIEYDGGSQGMLTKTPEVPEPGTLVLLSASLLVGAAVTWKRRG